MKNMTFLFILIATLGFSQKKAEDFKYIHNKRYTAIIIDPEKYPVEMYWKDDRGKLLRNFNNLADYVESKGKKLRFAMNGGMAMENRIPCGLFIQNFKEITHLNTRTNGRSNFCLQPNGVFIINDHNQAQICLTINYINPGNIRFATQSGVMPVVMGTMNPILTTFNKSLYVRNGIGTFNDGRVAFLISNNPISLHEFADYFVELGCYNALYLDGAISGMYFPEKDIEDEGSWGVMIGINF